MEAELKYRVEEMFPPTRPYQQAVKCRSKPDHQLEY